MKTEMILIKPTKKEAEKAKKLRVAAYCRVSTDTDEQQTSFEGQVKHYTELIEANPDWELADIYADEGITGTSAEKRPDFMRMVKDAEAKKFDLLITKSVSRFARNTVEMITYVRRLRELGIHLIFEMHNIDTRAPYSEMLLTVLGAFAQEESRNISENTTWGIRKRFQEGVTRWCRLYGYEKTEEEEYHIVPEEAMVVKKIFDLYEHGESIQNIRKHLAAHGISSPTGEDKWTNSAVHTLLTNVRYTGDIVLQKTITENHLTHRPLPNSAEKIPQYFVQSHHTPIITRAQYDRCMKIMGMRRVNGHKKKHDTGTCNQYPIGDKLRCPYCGSELYQRSVPVQSKHSAGWCCEQGDDACHGFIIRSYLVEAALLNAYLKLDVDKIAEKTKHKRFGEAAKRALEIKRENLAFERVDFWWVDELVDHIKFGEHSKTDRELRRMIALGRQVTDDRTMKVFWKCGLITTVISGVNSDLEHPAYIAKLYNSYLERQASRAEQEEMEETEKQQEVEELEAETA